MCVCAKTGMHAHTQRERERERERDTHTHTHTHKQTMTEYFVDITQIIIHYIKLITIKQT